ncbi:MAG: hypothetical protein QOH71_2215 [Blastocatellia bacterium]|jgi:hypothetical protein|nr:hypothetical protein [Blastocatellia bacterium]
MSAQLHFVGLYPIDLTQSSAQRIEVPKTAGIIDYAQNLIGTLLKDETNRIFKFGLTSGMRSSIDDLARGDYKASPQTIADRLLSTEKTTQKQYQQITTLLKGSLLQACFTTNRQKYVLITKVDHHAFLDEADLTKHVGMPYQEDVLRVLKACLVAVASDGSFERATIYDTNLRIAEYWWKDFLQLQEERTDEHNTQSAFYAFEHLLATQVKPKSKADYTSLRNDLVSHFRTRKAFSHKRLVKTILGNYAPSVDTIDVAALTAKADELPEKKNFDQQFNIQKGVNEGKYKNVIELGPNLQLLMKANVPDLNTVIQPFNDKGVKGIKIITEIGWEHFNRSAAVN